MVQLLSYARTAALGFFLSLSIQACQAQQGGSTVDATTLNREVTTRPVQLVDVRTADEFASGHISGAVNMDWRGADFLAGIARLDKSQPVRLYCASGRRSAEAREALSKAGFRDVHDLEGGIAAWQAAGGQLVK